MKRPTVSVIVPNYNHALFLRRRLESVLHQTYQDFEVIYLDDASSDHSDDVFAAFAEDDRIRAYFNDANTGIPGKQWNKGVQAARGEYIWIAESDDYADERFLERLVPHLEANPTVGLVYCQSLMVDEQETIVGSYDYLTEDLGRTRWRRDFFSRGRDECADYLFYKNTIPNASAVLFRRRIYEQAGGADEWIRYCGDWLLWVKMLMISDLIYVAEPLNYYRRHGNALSHPVPGTVGPSPLAQEDMDVPDLPFESELRRWPAKLRYILGRNALRANRPAEARRYFKESLRLHLAPAPLLFWSVSFLGRPVYQHLDGIKHRLPGFGRFVTRVNRFFISGYRLLTRLSPHRRARSPA